MPTLSTRSFAEMLNLPAYEQSRILHEQKYPKANSGLFKMPYYATALAGIRRYHKGGNDKDAIKNALDIAAVLKGPGKAPHNARVLNQYLNSSMAGRTFNNISLTINVSGKPKADVELRLKFDFEGDEKSKRKFVFFNCRDAALEPQVVTDTITIAHWILAENGILVDIKNIEYHDLKTGMLSSISRPSVKTIKRMRENAKIISSLWPTI